MKIIADDFQVVCEAGGSGHEANSSAMNRVGGIKRPVSSEFDKNSVAQMDNNEVRVSRETLTSIKRFACSCSTGP